MGNFARRTARSAAVAVMACAAALGASATAGAADDPSAKTPVKPFVVGGEEANIEDYPYTVRLITPDGFGFCGGSLVAPDKVVTAAHCVEGAELEDFKVVSGRTVMSSDEGTVSDVSDIWVHPEYDWSDFNHDVAVVTLAEPVDQGTVELAPLDDPAYQAGTMATTLGWGDTTEGGEQSDHLMKVDVPVTSDEECSAAYGSLYEADGMICAGFPEGGKDACNGDSGGPLVVGNKLIGVVSWGEGCARPGKPGVYSRIGSFYDELQEQIGGSEPTSPQK
ncbi:MULTISPECIES: serine protease [Thermocrispum]|uniref:Serine protease n=1 Tax=Thermocrispum agreste TaxID=37925 RepID=A0A2W4JNT3_9PSEU|nr:MULTISPECIES: serine protease [Thermocrispum]PZM99385.1 MAG: serine protease [Thermocrispum agreste]